MKTKTGNTATWRTSFNWAARLEFCN